MRHMAVAAWLLVGLGIGELAANMLVALFPVVLTE